MYAPFFLLGLPNVRIVSFFCLDFREKFRDILKLNSPVHRQTYIYPTTATVKNFPFVFFNDDWWVHLKRILPKQVWHLTVFEMACSERIYWPHLWSKMCKGIGKITPFNCWFLNRTRCHDFIMRHTKTTSITCTASLSDTRDLYLVEVILDSRSENSLNGFHFGSQSS